MLVTLETQELIVRGLTVFFFHYRRVHWIPSWMTQLSLPEGFAPWKRMWNFTS